MRKALHNIRVIFNIFNLLQSLRIFFVAWVLQRSYADFFKYFAKIFYKDIRNRNPKRIILQRPAGYNKSAFAHFFLYVSFGCFFILNILNICSKIIIVHFHYFDWWSFRVFKIKKNIYWAPAISHMNRLTA